MVIMVTVPSIILCPVQCYVAKFLPLSLGCPASVVVLARAPAGGGSLGTRNRSSVPGQSVSVTLSSYNDKLSLYVCMILCDFVGSNLSFRGNFPAVGRGWVIIM